MEQFFKTRKNTVKQALNLEVIVGATKKILAHFLNMIAERWGQ